MLTGFDEAWVRLDAACGFTIGTVSYTHLDVYKRQVFARPDFTPGEVALLGHWRRERAEGLGRNGQAALRSQTEKPTRAAFAPSVWRWDEDTQRSTGCRGWNRSARVLPAKGCHLSLIHL